MTKTPFLTKEKAEEIASVYPTPFTFTMKREYVKIVRIFTRRFRGIRASVNILR